MMRAQRHWPALVNSLRLYVYVYILVEFWWKKVGNRRIKSYASWDNLLPIMICFCLYLCRVFWGNKCFHSFIHSFNSRIWNPQTDRYAWHSSLRGASALPEPLLLCLWWLYQANLHRAERGTQRGNICLLVVQFAPRVQQHSFRLLGPAPMM